MERLAVRRTAIYLAIAFGFSWSIALIIYLLGGLSSSPPIAPGSAITWAFPLLTLYMLGPALGNVGARLLTREGAQDLWLRPRFKQSWKYWLIPWVLTPLMVIAGGLVYFALNPGALNLAALSGDSLPAIEGAPISPQLAILVNIVVAILLAPLINALPILGEEFGWRAYLQPKLLPLGERRTYLLVGLIWGVWHWPVIWMGYNYPGYPLWGSIAMVWFTFIAGTFFGWAALRAGSVWPAVIGHGALNGTANLWLLFVTAETNPLVGPYVVGLVGGIFFALAALIIMWRARS